MKYIFFSVLLFWILIVNITGSEFGDILSVWYSISGAGRCIEALKCGPIYYFVNFPIAPVGVKFYYCNGLQYPTMENLAHACGRAVSSSIGIIAIAAGALIPFLVLANFLIG